MSAEWDSGSDTPDPTLRPERLVEDGDKALRPKGLSEFIGQEAARANLNVFIQSARQRGEAMDHALFHGPPLSLIHISEPTRPY